VFLVSRHFTYFNVLYAGPALQVLQIAFDVNTASYVSVSQCDKASQDIRDLRVVAR